MGSHTRTVPYPADAGAAAAARDGARWRGHPDRQFGRPGIRTALTLLLACGPAWAQDEEQREFDAQFAAGLGALQAKSHADAERAFLRCQALASDLPAERRSAGAFAAALFVAETRWRARPTEDAVAHAALAAAAHVARTDGAWAAPGCEGLRLRALVLLWQTATPGSFRRDLDAADREWLLRDDFFAIEPRRMQSLHDPARVLRLQLAQGTPRELAALQQLVAMEEGWAKQVANGSSLAEDDLDCRGDALNALARYHAERRSFDRAQTYVDRMPAKDSLLVRCLLALQREDHTQAAALARELVAQKEPKGSQLLAEALEASQRDEDLNEALACYDQVLSVETDPLGRAAAHNGRGDCLQRLAGRLDDAERAYRGALALASGDSVGAIAERAETEKDLGRLEERRERAAEALRHYCTALDLGEHVRGQLLGDAFGGSWLAMHEDQTTAIDGVLRTFRAAGADPWVCMHALELGRARGALDVAGGGAPAIDPQELQQVVAEWLAATDTAALAVATAKVDALRARAATVPHSAVVPKPAELRDYAVQNAHATVLMWWLGRSEAWLAVLRGDAVEVLPLPDPAACRAQVALAYAAVATPDGDAAALPAAADCLLPAAARQQLGGVVLAVLDPTMARLPLAALPIDGVPLGIGRVLAQAPSLSVARLLSSSARASRGVGTIVVEAPERGELPQRLGLDALQFAAREAAAVARCHVGAVHMRGDGASLQGLMAAITASPPALLHLAVHAVDCPGLPTQSLLLLADGPLAMAGLGGLSLPGTLVVFSACAAAVGEQRGHEGVVGLVEGAFAAGARAVVAPVAEVNQQATADLMAQLHERLARGSEPAVALQAARSTLAEAANYRHPHYWGTFTVFSGIPGAPAASPPPVASSFATRRWWIAGWIAVLTAIAAALLLPRQQRRVGLR